MLKNGNRLALEIPNKKAEPDMRGNLANIDSIKRKKA